MRLRRAIAPAIFAAVFSLLLAQILTHPREMFLRLHDEHSYRIAAQLLGHFHLWMRPYPPAIAPFFDTIHLITDRAYASIYFIGAALFMVPSIWFHLPYWITPLFCGSAAATVFFLIASELFDPLRAGVAVFMLLSLKYFRWMCFTLMSEMPFLLLAMVLLFVWLRWRKNPTLPRALPIGLIAGWALITRPLDALCFCAVVGFAIVFELRAVPTRLLKTTLVIFAAASPFLALQLIQNVGVTGHIFQTPMQYYITASYPASPMGFHHADLKNLPPDFSPAKRAFAESWMDLYAQHTPALILKSLHGSRFHQLKTDTLPASFLIILAPLAFFSRWDIRRVVIVAVGLVDLLAYLDYIFPFDQYLVAAMPSILCLILIGAETLPRLVPKFHRELSTAIAAVLVVSSLWSFSTRMPDFCEPARDINDDLATLHTPSLVLFPFNASPHALDWFPVYNDDVAWPDDAQIIRANDLGSAKDQTLFSYYAHLHQMRDIFRYDPKSPVPHHLIPLGNTSAYAG